MEIVVTHNNMDFDALAAQFGVTRLHPQTKIVLGYPLVGNVREFLALYRSSLPIAHSKYIDLSRVSRIFVVDCHNVERLDDNLRKFILNAEDLPEIVIYDHHEQAGGGDLLELASKNSILKRVGAATSIMVDEMRRQRMRLTPFEATLLALGIYEDTGCLTFSGTTEIDARCIAYLLKEGADLDQVNHYIRPKLSENQAKLMESLVRNSELEWLEGSQIVISSSITDEYVDGLASLTRKLLDIVSADAAFCAVHMKDRIHLVGRSDGRCVDVRNVVRPFGGNGHPGAGSAVIKGGRDLENVLVEVKNLIKERVQPEPVATDVMTSPVRTIPPSCTMDEASRLMIRYAQDGFVVSDGESVVGVVSRRDIDQAIHHKLGHAPVQGFMSKPVISVESRTPLSEIQQVMVREDIGRLPVLDQNGMLIGLVSRRNVLHARYGDYGPAGPSDMETMGETAESIENFLPRTKGGVRHVHFSEQMETLSPSIKWLCRQIGEVAARKGMVAYGVGGFVRDLFLGRPNFDLDYVVEGNAIELAESLESEFPSRFEIAAKHDRFKTATLLYHAEVIKEVDISTARTEFYEFPAALPTVEPSHLEQDLLRRDFTINSLAVCLNPGHYSELVDHFDGLSDLKKKKLRILHPFSFIEDPTRILRAARFGARLGFELEHKTRDCARRAISMGIFDDLGGVRMREEIKMILESSQRLSGLEILESLGGCLRFLDSGLEFSRRTKTLIRRAERLLERYSVSEPWVVYLGLLLSSVPEERLSLLLERLHLANGQRRAIKRGIDLVSKEELSGLRLKKSEIYRALNGIEPESLAIAASLAAPMTRVRRCISLYLRDLVDVSVELTGKDLVEMGVRQGPAVGELLDDLLARRLDGQIASEEDERLYVMQIVQSCGSSSSGKN